MLFKKVTLALLLSSLVACGGGSSDGSDIGVNPPPKPDPEPEPDPITTSVNGKAIKGTIANASITVFKYVDGEPVELTEDELQESEVTSNTDGSYTLTLLDYDGPVKVVVGVSTDTDNPTTMVCDAPNGCGGVAFGQSVNLTTTAADFKLSSVSTVTSGEEVVVNVSPLTHIATALVEKDGVVDEEVIATKKSQVANLFGVDGDITTLESTQIENNGDVAAEDNEAELRYALVNAGIASALFSNGEDIADNLEQAVDDLVENDGQMLVSDDGDDAFELNISEVLEAAAQTAELVAQNIENDESISDADSQVSLLTQTATNMENERQNQLLTAGDDGRTDVSAEELTADDAVAKAKAMVGDVRVFANLFDEDHPSNEEITTQGEEFRTLISSASDMIEAEEAAFVILSDLSEVLTEITMSDNTQTQYDLAQFQSLNGLQGQIMVDEDNYEFSVDATNELGQSVVFDADLSLSDDGTELTFTLGGNLESDNATASIAADSFISVQLSESVTQQQLEDGDTEAEIVSGDVSLRVEMSQKQTEAVPNPVSFYGDLVMSLHMIEAPEIRTHYFSENSWQNDLLGNESLYFTESKKRPYPANLTLSGGFSSLQGEEISATLTVDIKDVDSFEASGFASGIGEPANMPVMFVSISEDANTVEWHTNEELFESTYGSKYEYDGFDDGQSSGFVLSISYLDSEKIITHTDNYLITSTTSSETEGTLKVYTKKRIYSAETFVYLSYQTAEEFDLNGDGIVDEYHYYRENAYIQSEDLLDMEYTFESAFNNSGSIIVNQDLVRANEYYEQPNWYVSFDDFVNVNIGGYGLELTSALDAFYGGFVRNKYGEPIYDVWDTEIGTLLTDSSGIENVEPGAQNVPIDGLIVQPIVKDALSIEISDDNSEIMLEAGDYYSQMISLSSADANPITNKYEINTEYGNEDIVITMESLIVDEGTDYAREGVIYNIDTTARYQDGYEFRYVETLIALPVMLIIDGVVTDTWEVHEGVGYDFGLDDITDESGNITRDFIFNSEDTVKRINALYGLTVTTDDLLNRSADQLLKNLIEGAQKLEPDNYGYYEQHFLNAYGPINMDGYGRIGNFSLFDEPADELGIMAGASLSFDAVVIEPEGSVGLESEDNFLDLSAALSVSLILQDYEIDLMLSGERTALDDGKFRLDASYKVPGDESQRSFRVMVESMDSDTFVVGNSDGVVFTMFPEADDTQENDAEDGTESEGEGTETVIGDIRVGPDGILAAEVVKRDGVTLIRYKDDEGSVETL